MSGFIRPLQFLHYAKYSIYNKQSEEIIQSAQDYVRQLIANGEIPLRPPNGTPSFGWEAASGLGFYSHDDPKFIEFREFVSQETKKAFEADLPDQASKLLELVGVDTLLFAQRLILSNHAENLYFQTPVLDLLEVNSFVDKPLMASLYDKQIISEMLKQRYCFQGYNIFLVKELPWLKQVAEKLRAEVNTRAGKISSLTIKDSLAAIEEAISNLEPKS